MVCDLCRKGVYRHDPNREILVKPSNQYPHVCSHCKNAVYIAKRYPLIKYKELD